MSENSDSVVKPGFFIVRARARELAKSKGKVLSSSFLNYLDLQVREFVERSCHVIGNRKIVKAQEIRDYQNLIGKFGGG